MPRGDAATKGSIINIASINGVMGNRDMSTYHGTNGAVRLMTKTDAVLYARKGIRVNCVHPGSIRTPLSEHIARNHPDGPRRTSRPSRPPIICQGRLLSVGPSIRSASCRP